MADWTPISHRMGIQPVTTNDTDQNHELGYRMWANDTDTDTNYGDVEFIYLKGVASTAVGSLVKYNPDDWSTSLATAGDRGNLAVAMSACVASEYGWYAIFGKVPVKALTGFADNADCYLTSTAGSIDDAVVAGDKISNMIGASAVASGLADVEIRYPKVETPAFQNNLVVVTDAATYTALEANSGKVHVMPDLTADCAITMPAAKNGLDFTFIYGGVAADAQDWNFDFLSDTNFLLGGVAHLDADSGSSADEVVPVAPDGNSNSKMNVLVPDVGTWVRFMCDGTNWYVTGAVVGATAPTYADQ